jgi:hypothetical protein
VICQKNAHSDQQIPGDEKVHQAVSKMQLAANDGEQFRAGMLATTVPDENRTIDSEHLPSSHLENRMAELLELLFYKKKKKLNKHTVTTVLW